MASLVPVTHCDRAESPDRPLKEFARCWAGSASATLMLRDSVPGRAANRSRGSMLHLSILRFHPSCIGSGSTDVLAAGAKPLGPRTRKLNSNAAHSLCMPMSSKIRSFVDGFPHR